MLTVTILRQLTESKLVSPRMQSSLLEKAAADLPLPLVWELVKLSSQPIPELEHRLFGSLLMLRIYTYRFPHRKDPMRELAPSMLSTKPESSRDFWEGEWRELLG